MEARVVEYHQEASKRMYCGCGNVMKEEQITVTWTDKNGDKYVISDVPIIQCNHNGCYESYYPGDVEINLAILAEEMENGVLSKTIPYQERI